MMENKKLNIKNQKYISKFKIFTFYFVILLFTFYISIFTTSVTVYATDATPSSDIKSKLEELKKEIASKAAKLKQEVGKKLTNRAYIGKVKTKSDTSLTIATKNGPKIVNINQDTNFNSNVKGKKYSQKLIAEEDYVASLGDIDETQVLTAKKVILLDPKPSSLTPKTYLWGQATAISDKLVTLKNRHLKNISVSLPNGSNIKLNDFVILTGIMGKNEIFEAEFVYVIPQGGFIRPKIKIATPSAQISTKSGQTKK